jgi:hypothetical protein
VLYLAEEVGEAELNVISGDIVLRAEPDDDDEFADLISDNN